MGGDSMEKVQRRVDQRLRASPDAATGMNGRRFAIATPIHALINLIAPRLGPSVLATNQRPWGDFASQQSDALGGAVSFGFRSSTRRRFVLASACAI